jgi:hypothetical protein
MTDMRVSEMAPSSGLLALEMKAGATSETSFVTYETTWNITAEN